MYPMILHIPTLQSLNLYVMHIILASCSPSHYSRLSIIFLYLLEYPYLFSFSSNIDIDSWLHRVNKVIFSYNQQSIRCSVHVSIQERMHAVLFNLRKAPIDLKETYNNIVALDSLIFVCLRSIRR